MTTWASVGKSRYRGDVLGEEQFMEARAARQVLALIAFIATLPGCRRMTVNEGRRTRARQKLLRQRFEAYLRGGPWAPLAAVLYTSRHDEVNHGNAADLGGPDGEALNAAERAAISKYGPDFGVHFVGLTFSPPEPWHVEADGITPTPQYALAAAAAQAPAPTSEEDDMFKPRFIRVVEPNHLLNGLVSFAFSDRVVRTKNATEIYRIGRFWGLIAPNQKWEEAKTLENISVVEFIDGENEINAARTLLRGEHAKAVAEAVWAFLLKGYNGAQTAAARLAGIDEKAGKK